MKKEERFLFFAQKWETNLPQTRARTRCAVAPRPLLLPFRGTCPVFSSGRGVAPWHFKCANVKLMAYST